MRARLAALSLLIVVVLSGFALAAAQDTSTEGSINCDSDVLLNLYIANRFFGYDQLQSQMMQNGTATFDTNAFNRGQFGNLYNSWSTMQGAAGSTDASGSTSGDTASADATAEAGATTGMTGQYGLLSQDQFTNLSNNLTQDDATFDQQFNTTFGFDPNAGTSLAPATIAGEAAECTNLRTSLNRFWRAVALEDFNSGMSLGNLGASAVPAASG